MFRFCVLQVARFKDSGIINLKIKIERYSTKNEIGYTTKSSGSSVNSTIQKLLMTNKDKLNVKESSTLLSQSKENILNAKPKFEIMKNLESFPISGNGIQCTTGKSDLNPPGVVQIIKNTITDDFKRNIEIRNNKIISEFGEEFLKSFYAELTQKGTLLHKYLFNELCMKHKKVSVDPRMELVYQSIQPALKYLRKIHAVETHVQHPTLCYQGCVDCIASDSDGLCIIDWKITSKCNISLSNIGRSPLQVAAYIGAINASNNFSFQINRGLIIVAHVTGAPATIFELKGSILQNQWVAWLERLEKFYTKLNNK